MIEQDLPLHEEEFLVFMERAVPELLGIELKELTDTYDFRTRLAELEAKKTAILSVDIPDVTDWTHSYSENARIIDKKDGKAEEKEDNYNRSGILPSPYNTATLEIFGKKLIEMVAADLPQEIAEAADAWRGATREERHDIVDFVYDRLRYETWTKAHPDHKDEVNEYDQTIFNIASIHPNNLKNWPNSERTSCLGTSLLLAGFAHRSGARFMYTNTIRHRQQELFEMQQQVADLARDSVVELGIGISASWSNYFDAVDADSHHYNSEVLDFHHAIAIEVDKRDWRYLDPYMLNKGKMYGFFEESFVVEQIRQASKTSPGRTILASAADGFIKRCYDALSVGGDQFKAVSVALRDHLDHFIQVQRNVDVEFDVFRGFIKLFDPEEVIDSAEMHRHFTNWNLRLAELDPEEILFRILDGRLVVQEKAKLMKKIKVAVQLAAEAYERAEPSGEAKKDIVIDLGAVEDQPKPPETINEIIERFDFDFRERFKTDRAFRERLIDDMLFTPFARYLDTSMHRDFGSGDYIPDTSIEFSNPYFFPGLMALNHLRVWADYGNKYVSSAIAEQTSSQIAWHEAMMDAAPHTTEMLDDLEDRLAELEDYFVHHRVAWRLAQRAIEREAHSGKKEVDR